MMLKLPEARRSEGRETRRAPTASVLVIWVAVCLLVFVPYGLVEGRWLGGLSQEVRGLVHLLRGTIAALLATLVTAAYLYRRAVPGLEQSLRGTADPGKAGALAMGEGLARWMLGLRWAAGVAAAAAVALATLGTGRLAPGSAPPLWAGVAVLFAFNATLGLLGPRRLASQRALGLQVATDALVLGWLVHFAGGMRNPFAGFFGFHAVTAAVLLEPHKARTVAGGIAAFVLGLAAIEITGLAPPGCLLDAQGVCPPADRLLEAAAGAAVATMVVVCGLIATALVRALRSERDRLAEATATLAAHAEHLAAAQADVQRERAHLQAIIDCMADAVLYVAPDATVRLRNQAAERFFAGRKETGPDLRICHPPERWRGLLDKLADPGPVEAHAVFRVEGRSYEASYAPVRNGDSSLRGVVMVARDVTERIEAQRWLVQEERMAVVGKLAAGIAHEINNPLGAIALFAQHALSGLAPDHPLRDHLGTVLRNANLCKRIVRDLLEYARQRPPERRLVALEELLGDVVRTLEPQAQASRVAVRSQGWNGAQPVVYGDPDQLRQVLVNLGLNAIEAMPEGGQLTFRIGTAAGDRARIDVIDTGTGIPVEEQERIFSAFHTTKSEGTGLGLTVARDLMTAHGGTIAVDSVPGRGSTFSVVLPTRPDDAPAEVVP